MDETGANMRTKRSRSGLSSRLELRVVVAPRRRTGGESVEGEGASACVERPGATEAARCPHTQLVRVQAAKEADRCGWNSAAPV